MNAVYRNQPALDHLFDDADTQYAQIKKSLISQDFHDRAEADVERLLHVEQHELMRRLLQSHVTLRGQDEAVGPVVGADGVERSHVRHGKTRQLATTFGPVVVERTAHAGRGLSALHPVDASMNLPVRSYSHEVERQVGMTAARMSFDAALSMLAELTAAGVPKRQAEELVQQAAKDFEAFYAKTGFLVGTPLSGLLALSFDHKGVVMRKEDLSKATRKASENKKSKLDTRVSKGEVKRGHKRMATVAAVYTAAPFVRTAQDVIAGLKHVRDATQKPRPRPEFKRVWASLTRSPQEVIAEAFAEAQKRDPEHKKHWLVRVDGCPKLERWVLAEAKRIGVQVTLVLDFIHALEYLWRAAHVFFDEGTPAIEAWVMERLDAMLQGKISNVVAGMTRMATVRKLTKQARAPVDKAAKYFLKRKGMMRYGELLALGAPIASGIIEGACRHLINDRLDLTGARWRLPSAEAVLRLRSLLSSGDFDSYWQFHEAEEARRNHASRYADGKLPEVKIPSGKRHLRVVRGGGGGVD